MEVKQSVAQNHCAQTGQIDLQRIEDVESPTLSYPKRIIFLLASEACERFTYFGSTAILVLYLNQKLGYSENDASALYHGFSMAIHLFCIFGGIISDVWLGKFKTILYFSIVYALGCVALSISAFPNIGISPQVVLILGLSFIAIGHGCTGPSSNAFGGDQFKLPEQAMQLATFFSMIYFAANVGSTISTALTPFLRSDIHCFEENDCYPLAFGMPAILMIVSIVFFVVGKSSYTIVEVSSENLLVQVTKCISHAIISKFREGRCTPRKNLLDHSVEKFGEQLVEDIRSLQRILILYLPIPLFWTLYEQQGSKWTFQARQMCGDIGFYELKPDQMQMLNPLLVLIMIPLFELAVYPMLRRMGLRRPLQKMVLGGFLAAMSFVIAALVQFKIEASPENTVHSLWQLPQYICLTAGEILFSTVGYQFSYEEAPKSLKSIVSAFWSLTMAVGSLITLVLVSKIRIFENQSYEFLFFASLMFVDILLFGILAYFYKSSVRRSDKQQI